MDPNKGLEGIPAEGVAAIDGDTEAFMPSGLTELTSMFTGNGLDATGTEVTGAESVVEAVEVGTSKEGGDVAAGTREAVILSTFAG